MNKVICEKCGNDDINIVYCKVGDTFISNYSSELESFGVIAQISEYSMAEQLTITEECLHMNCKRCQYVWVSQPNNPSKNDLVIEKYDEPLLQTAFNFSELSKCERLKVGAVIAKDGRPLVTGYNGTVSGTDNCCEEVEGEELLCTRCGNDSQSSLYISSGDFLGNLCYKCNYRGVVKKTPILKTSDFVIHAEQNAIFFAAKHGISVDGCTMYITHAPCSQCAKAIASSGISRVVYARKYRNNDGIRFLESCGINVILSEYSV